MGKENKRKKSTMFFNNNGRSYPVLNSNTNSTIHSKKISQRPDLNQHEHEVDTHSQQPRTPLGLKLPRTQSMIVQIQQLRLALKRQKNNSESNAIMMKKNLNAAKFPITNLQIGRWQINSMSQGHLTAKIYFKKERLIWEILDGSLKKKIEILWSNIKAIARKYENGTEILEIALHKAPLIQDEIEPQPGKHTKWKDVFDFTGGEASTWRIHVLQFPQGSLDVHYDNLLKCDTHLDKLSQKPFPSQMLPFFQPNPYDSSQLSFHRDIKPPYPHEPQYHHDAPLAIRRDMNPSTPLPILSGFSHGNEFPFHQGSEINATTMVQPDNNYQHNPMLNVEQTPMSSHLEASLLKQTPLMLSHPDDEPEYCPDLEDDIDKYVYGSPNEPEIGVESAPFHPTMTYNPSTQMPVFTGYSHGNELISSNTGLRIDTTTVQPINHSQNYPMNYDEQTPLMLSHPDTSVLNPQIQPGLDDKENKYLWGLLNNPVVNVELDSFPLQLTAMEPEAGESNCLSGRYDTFSGKGFS